MKKALRTAAAIWASAGVELTPTQVLETVRQVYANCETFLRREGKPIAATDEGRLFYLEVQFDGFLYREARRR